ncbi:glycoside hydrolase family 28 protein [Sphingobacterium sp. SGR-19]|uniref:glycoside hydrolase family 28 protein n=1 Tax=Sphingobacterium sp. SGR-19 TaxID=2710886 RepID=UPI001F0E0754|nr:glycoside hydrolase family 28 protein [Sphingobacterium sp. SGR-19]
MMTSVYNIILSFFVYLFSFSLVVGQEAEVPLEWHSKVGAQSKPTQTKEFFVNDYGGKNNDSTLNTVAIQSAIDACAEAGGGIVRFRPGSYLTGSLFVKSNVQLHIDSNVTLLGSQNIDDYKLIDTRVAGIEMEWPAALINILDQEHTVISGKGLIHAQGKPFWEQYWRMRTDEYEPKGLRWIVDYDVRRPRTILVSGAKNITLKDLEIQQAGFWTVQILYSTHVTVDGLTINNNVDGHGPSTDGIDIDSSSWILVQNTDIDCNDDNFCIKAGRDADGLRVNRPSEYIVIRNCFARRGAGLLTLGSETSGSIRHVYASNIQGSGTKNCLNIKSAVTRGGTVEHIVLENVWMDSVGVVLQVNMNWNPSYSYSKLPEGYDHEDIPEHWITLLQPVEPAERGIPTFRDITMRNVHIKGANRAINVEGLPSSWVERITLQNVSIEAKEAGKIRYSKNWNVRDFELQTKDGSTIGKENTANITL